MRRPVAPHRSLVFRLLAAAVLIVAVSVATAAWLAAETATRAVQEERNTTLATDTRILDTLLGYAATHPGWEGVEPVVRRLSDETGRRILLTDGAGAPLAGVAGDLPLPARPTAVVDPLGGEVPDPRAVGPYALSRTERTEQHALAATRVACLGKQGVPARLEETPSGRAVVRLTTGNPRLQRNCLLGEDKATRTESRALDRLSAEVRGCLRDRKLPPVDLYDVDFTWAYRNAADGGRTRDIQDCVNRGRREQLRPYVAGAARLYLSSPARPSVPVFDLSTASTRRIAGATGFVLVLAVTLTLAVGLRLVRPLRALTAAVDRATVRPAPVAITRNDEIGRLAGAFNDLAARSEHSEEQRRTMVNDIAHELRTPLTNIRNWLTAGQDGLAELDQDLLRLLLEEAGLLQHIVDDLSDLAEADAGTLALEPSEQSVADLLHQVTEAHRGAAAGAGTELRLTVAADPWARLDPVRFRQIVANLLTNAIRHTPAGGRVEVRAGAEAGDLVVAVTDTGTGITEQDLPHVFDRFWRADRARSRTGAAGGSGLGLAIARKLAQAHGGDLSARSTPGAGSTFTLRLPGPVT